MRLVGGGGVGGYWQARRARSTPAKGMCPSKGSLTALLGDGDHMEGKLSGKLP
jgi:hypothetical protein